MNRMVSPISCYGVWNGQPDALCFLRTGTLHLSDGDRVLLCTGGQNAFLASISARELAGLDSVSLLQQAMAFETAGWMTERQLLLRRRSKFAPHASVNLLRHSIWFAQLCPAKR